MIAGALITYQPGHAPAGMLDNAGRSPASRLLIERMRDHRESEAVSDVRVPQRVAITPLIVAAVDPHRAVSLQRKRLELAAAQEITAGSRIAPTLSPAPAPHDPASARGPRSR